jgi:pantoate--beta-alanine ligase
MMGPEVCTSLSILPARLDEFRREGKKIALVPTMGALHEGHLRVVKLARASADRTVVSIFVNPAQFSDPKDLERYPRTLKEDVALLATVGTAMVFAPPAEEIYPPHFQSWVNVEQLGKRYEEAARPGHFRGVATVVSMLLNIIRPTIAVFGEKDFQQLRVIEQMAADLKLPTNIVRAPIVREDDGLAMSSRNRRLSAEGRRAAAVLSRGLHIARDARVGGEQRASALKEMALDVIRSEQRVAVDYLEVADETTLDPLNMVEKPARMLVAAVVDGVRLIDNIAL